MAHRLSPEPEAELDGIWYYIATESGSMEVADRFVETITKRFFLLAMSPYMGRRRDEDLRPGIRSFVVGKYIILYRIDGEVSTKQHPLPPETSCAAHPPLWRNPHGLVRWKLVAAAIHIKINA